MWARKGVALHACPKSTITGDSLAMVEDFLIRRRLGGVNWSRLSAREAEAFVILETMLAAEIKSGQHTRQTAR